MNILYVNHAGEVLNLTKWPYRIQTGSLLDYSWTYAANGRGRICSLSRSAQEKSVTITVKGANRKEYCEAMDRLHDVPERDVQAGIPGRIFVGDMYLPCFLIGSTKTEWEDLVNESDAALKVVTDSPDWIREKRYLFSEASPQSAGDLDFPYDFPHDFSRSGSEYAIRNDFPAPCDFLMEVFGPAINPSIEINGHKHCVLASVSAGEILRVDSLSGTILRITETGSTENEFHKRYLEEDVFQKIQQGDAAVHKDGSYPVALTLYMKRSEPAWVEESGELEDNLDVYLLDEEWKPVFDDANNKIKTGGV